MKQDLIAKASTSESRMAVSKSSKKLNEYNEKKNLKKNGGKKNN